MACILIVATPIIQKTALGAWFQPIFVITFSESEIEIYHGFFFFKLQIYVYEKFLKSKALTHESNFHIYILSLYHSNLRCQHDKDGDSWFIFMFTVPNNVSEYGRTQFIDVKSI